MDGIDYEFLQLEPEFPDALVPEPQVLVFDLDINTRLVYVYFTTNRAQRITGSAVTSGMGKLNLWYTGEFPDNAINMSLRLNKISYRFTNSQGLARNIVFCGERKRPTKSKQKANKTDA